jgi:hypothetical protein
MVPRYTVVQSVPLDFRTRSTPVHKHIDGLQEELLVARGSLDVRVTLEGLNPLLPARAWHWFCPTPHLAKYPGHT